MTIVRDHGSFRDPSGYVAHYGDRIFRILREDAFSSFEWLKSSGFLAELVGKKWLVATEVASDPAVQDISRHVLEHEAISFISYPYEWPFELLKRAALFHLDLHLLALESNFTLIDASAYNVQFIGTRPIFIDPLSLVCYREGEFWLGQRQFCDQFLNPLLLTSLVKIPFNAWYRGSLEGIASEDLARALRPKHKLSWRIWSEVLIPVWLQRSARSASSCSCVSIPSASVTRPSVCPSSMSVWISADASGERLMSATKERSIFNTSTGNCLRYASEE